MLVMTRLKLGVLGGRNNQAAWKEGLLNSIVIFWLNPAQALRDKNQVAAITKWVAVVVASRGSGKETICQYQRRLEEWRAIGMGRTID